VLVVWGTCDDDPTKIDGVMVMHGNDLVTWLREQRQVVTSTEDVARLIVGLERLRPARAAAAL
jgi:hypothetical protein